MTLFEIGAMLLGLSAVFGFINHYWIRLPHTIGLVLMALAASGMVIFADFLVPRFGISQTVTEELRQIDFSATLMEGMLSILLFAGAVHVDLEQMAQRKWTIGIMATLGVITSTFLVGGIIYFIMQMAGVDMPFIWALVFGSLISPTDPVAVLGLLKTIRIPPLLKAKIAGESLFNDGVGVVVFTIMVAIAMGGGAHGEEIGTLTVIKLFLGEALGGAILGIVAGYIAYWAMCRIDEHNIEVLITLALVFVTYAIALRLHLSGPIAVVIAGLFIGNHGAKFAMSKNTREHVFQFWELLDEILNSVLFLLIGLEVLIVGRDLLHLPIALAAIPAALFARYVAVAIPIKLLSVREKFEDGSIAILTWGGLRGGISVALALSLPDVPEKPTILAATYAVVVFSIVGQGLTMKRLVQRYNFRGAGVEPEDDH
jgi:CPA1 family monovalent cation:H+ antiporter